LIFITNKCHFS